MRHRPGFNLPLTVLILFVITTGICYLLMYGTRPYMGDDLNYYVSNGEWIETHSPALLRLPTHIAGCWLSINGRAADSLNILFMNFMPRWLLAFLCGAAVSALYLLDIAWTRVWCHGRGWASLAAILLFALLPWWDSNMLLVVQFNYVWPSALMLGALWIVFRTPLASRWWLLTAPVMFFIGQGHEGCGLPVALGLALWCLTCRDAFRTMPRINRALMSCMMAGGVFTVSPAILHRATASAIPDDPLWLLLLKSDLLALVLCAALVWMLAKNRRGLLALCRTPWIVFAAASLISMSISGYSGIVGRSGWFAQVFALVALAGIASEMFPLRDMGRALLTALGAVLLLMTAQTVGVCALQLRANREAAQILTLYEKSPDGMVRYDVTPRSRLPWWTFGRVKGLFPAYDRWSNEVLSRLDPKGRILLVVPAGFPEIPVFGEGTRIDLGNGIFLTASPMQNTVTRIEGNAYTVRRLPASYPGLYICAPFDPLPGDRITSASGPVF